MKDKLCDQIKDELLNGNSNIYEIEKMFDDHLDKCQNCHDMLYSLKEIQCEAEEIPSSEIEINVLNAFNQFHEKVTLWDLVKSFFVFKVPIYQFVLIIALAIPIPYGYRVLTKKESQEPAGRFASVNNSLPNYKKGVSNIEDTLRINHYTANSMFIR
jgi:hypothetical protein